MKWLFFFCIPLANSAYIDLSEEDKAELLLSLDKTNQQYLKRVNKQAFDRARKYTIDYYFCRLLLFSATTFQLYTHCHTTDASAMDMPALNLDSLLSIQTLSSHRSFFACVFLVCAEAMPFIIGLNYDRQHIGEIVRCAFLISNTFLTWQHSPWINLFSLSLSFLNLALLSQIQKNQYQDIFLLQDVKLAHNFKPSNEF